jgi:hypothetical protein
MSGNEQEILQRPFGAESRRQMLGEWFAAATAAPAPASAWEHVYRLLLWIDRTTGLAHCYESDKSQPGRPWYERSLRFHDWAAQALSASPIGLAAEVDWLFRKGTTRLAEAAARIEAERAQIAAAQRDAYPSFPVPGDDPELETLILDQLAPWLASAPPREALAELTRVVRNYFTQENKRRNLVGEGFEDVLAAIIQRLPGGEKLTVMARPLLSEVPGFRPPPRGEKERRVDLAVIGSDSGRTLVSVKWSVRADREEQFGIDWEAYARLEDEGRDFDFVLVTNEFDAARLAAACDRRRPGADLFTSVVHVNPAGPLAAYGPKRRGAAVRLDSLIASRRLVSLEAWLSALLG